MTAPEGDLPAIAARAVHMMGEGGAALAGDAAIAWEGMLELGKRLRRSAEDLLSDEHDLSVSMVGVAGRLVLAPVHTLRQHALADAMALSVSRTSRVIDLLEARGLVVRESCPFDARATNVVLTANGVARTTAAQAALHDHVRRAFLDRLDADDAEALARIMRRLLT